MQKTFKLRASKKSAQFQALSRSSPFEGQLYCHSLMILEECIRKRHVYALHNYFSFIRETYGVQWAILASN